MKDDPHPPKKKIPSGKCGSTKATYRFTVHKGMWERPRAARHRVKFPKIIYSRFGSGLNAEMLVIQGEQTVA